MLKRVLTRAVVFLGLLATGCPPADPTALEQAETPGGLAVPVGFVDDDPTMACRATLSDPDTGDTVWLELEIKPSGAAFDGVGTILGTTVPNTGGASESTVSLANGDYHWRCRAVDSNGEMSAWVEYDSALTPDLTINTPPPPPPPPPPPSGSGVQDHPWYSINDTLCGGCAQSARPPGTIALALVLAGVLALLLKR